MAFSFEDALTSGESVTTAVGTLAGRFDERQEAVTAARSVVDADVERITDAREQLEDVTDATAALLTEQSAETTEQIEELVGRINGLREAAAVRFKELVAQFESLVDGVESAKEALSTKYREAFDAQRQLVEGLREAKDTVATRAEALADALVEHAVPAIEHVEQEMHSAHEAVLSDWRSTRSEAIERGVLSLSAAVGSVRDSGCRLLEDQRTHVGEASQAALSNLKNSVQTSMGQLKRRASEIEQTIDRVKHLVTDTGRATTQSMTLLDDSAKSVGVGLQAALGCLNEVKRILERGRG